MTRVWVAGRQNGSPEDACNKAAARCGANYREHMVYLAAQPLLARSYERLDLDRLRRTATKTDNAGPVASRPDVTAPSSTRLQHRDQQESCGDAAVPVT